MQGNSNVFRVNPRKVKCWSWQRCHPVGHRKQGFERTFVDHLDAAHDVAFFCDPPPDPRWRAAWPT